MTVNIPDINITNPWDMGITTHFCISLQLVRKKNSKGRSLYNTGGLGWGLNPFSTDFAAQHESSGFYGPFDSTILPPCLCKYWSHWWYYKAKYVGIILSAWSILDFCDYKNLNEL